MYLHLPRSRFLFPTPSPRFFALQDFFSSGTSSLPESFASKKNIDGTAVGFKLFLRPVSDVR